MRNEHKTRSAGRAAAGFDPLASDSNFYSGSPSERPLYEQHNLSEAQRVRKTRRHQAVAGRRKEGIDPREKMALLAILKAGVVLVLLVIAFFLLWKGIKLYEESIWIENQRPEEAAPVLREVVQLEEFDIGDQDSRILFAERVKMWDEAERLVRSADTFMQRNNIDQAIGRCQEALRLDPFHMGALERLGRLYKAQGMHVEAINAYIRALSVDPSREDLHLGLIDLLDQRGDSDAVVFMARWYFGQHTYNADVQRHLASALYQKGEFAEAAEAFERALKDAPEDVGILEQLAKARIQLGEYDKALPSLEKLRELNFNEQTYYLLIAVCHAQLGHGLETVQTLGKAAHLFGQNTVVGWMQDPRLDPVRQDRTFQAFADRVGGEEFRKWLERVAQSMESEDREKVMPQLTLPERETIDTELLKPRK